MNNLVGIVANITGFITYFAPGFFFFSCFYFASFQKQEKQIDFLLIKSISMSFLLFVCSQILGQKMKWNELEIQICCFAIAVICGLIAGRLHRIGWINRISAFIFNRELSNNFYVSLCEQANENNSAAYVVLTLKNGEVYEGQIDRYITYNDEPALQLSFYQCYSPKLTLVYDYSKIEGAGLIILCSEITRIEYQLLPIT